MAGHQTRTLKFQGRANSQESLERLRTVLAQLGELYDACLYQHRLAEHREPKHFNEFRQKKELTQLRADFPEFDGVFRRAQATTIKRANTNWARYRKNPSAGRPRYKGCRYRTLEVDSPGGRPITFTKYGHPVLHLKGLPTTRLRGPRETPKDSQPTRITVTLKGRRVLVRLGYRHELPESQDPTRATNALGIDVGIALTIATSSGDAYTSPNQEKLDRRIRTAQQTLSRAISASVATGRAGFRAVLDQNNRQTVSKTGTPHAEIGVDRRRPHPVLPPRQGQARRPPRETGIPQTGLPTQGDHPGGETGSRRRARPHRHGEAEHPGNDRLRPGNSGTPGPERPRQVGAQPPDTGAGLGGGPHDVGIQS